MSDDVPTPDAAGGDEATPWYSRPAAWIVAVIIIVVALVIILLAINDDDDEADDSTATSTTTTASTTTVSETTTSAAETTTSTAETTTSAPATTEAPVDAVAIEASSVNAQLSDENYLPPDFDPSEVTAHWYRWEDVHVVVYAGFDATTGETQCPGNSIAVDGEFRNITNSPSADGGCDPEEEFAKIIPDGDDGTDGAQVCDTLVIYVTEIPLEDDAGEPQSGTLFGSIEQFTDEGFAGATSQVDTDAEALTELDPYADAYTTPDGFLPDGATEVVC